MSNIRVVKRDDYFQVQYKHRSLFGRERWYAAEKWFEGPPANFDTFDDAVKFAKSFENGEEPENVVWDA